MARAHRWPRGDFASPGRRGRNLHSYLHFLIAPAGFPGQRLALVSMAGFVQTWSTEGGTKRPQWPCHSPASKAAGGAGRGTAACPPRQPRARGRGGCGRWAGTGGSSPGDTRRQRLLRARRKWCKSWTQMFPLFSFPVVFSQLSTQLGGLLSPSSFPLHSGTVWVAAVPIQVPCWPRDSAGQAKQSREKPVLTPQLQAQCHRAGERLQPMSLHHPGHGDRDAATTTREEPISVLLFQGFFLFYSYQLSSPSPCAAQSLPALTTSKLIPRVRGEPPSHTSHLGFHPQDTDS